MSQPDPALLARSVFDESAEALFLADPAQLCVMDANPAAAGLCGRPLEALLGLGLADLFRAEPPHSSDELTEALRQGRSYQAPSGYRLRHAGPWAETPVSVRARPLGPGGPALLSVSEIRGGSRASAPEALRSSEERLTRIVEAVADGILLVDLAQRITFANTAAERMVGRPRRVLTSRCWHELQWEDDPGAPPFDPVGVGRRVLEGSETLAGVAVALRRFTGERLHLSAGFVPLGDGRGGVTGMVVSLTDLTAQFAAREAIRRSEERFRALVEKSGDGIALLDKAGVIAYLSPATERIIGRQPDAACGRPFLALVHPEDAADARARFEALTARPGEETRCHCRVRHADGRWVTLDLVGFNRLAEPGVESVVINFRDVTDRVRAEEALRESEARYRRLFEGSLAGVFRNRLDGTILECNDAFAHVFGYGSAAEMRGVNAAANYLSPAARESKLELLHQRGRLSNHLTRSRRRDGSDIWVLENTSLVMGPDGEQVIEGTVIDLTEQRRAAEQLARDHALLRALIQSIPDLIFYKDREGRYLGCNRTFEEYVGVREEDLIGHSTAEVFPAGQAVLHEREDLEVYSARRPVRVEKWLPHADGRRLVETVLTPLLGADGEVLGLLGIGRDITDRQRAEEQDRQTAKMEAIGRLAGGIAHDFNNLLTVILGNVAMAQASADADATTRDALADCERAAARAAELTNQLLGFARRTPLTPEPLDLNRRADETVGLLRRAIDPRVEVEFRPAAGLWTVEADRAQLSQVLMNLCLNARDAMPDGGRLVIETANLALDDAAARLHPDSRPGEFVRLTVSDTGHGIAPEVRARIFEPFFTTKPFGQGTGLGLAMVFGIVQQHRGWVECHSEPGVGTRFDVYLPRSHRQPEAPPAPAPVPPPGRETVLLVDDEPMIRDLGRAALQQFGYRVLLAENGLDALDVYRSRGSEIDLVLLDLTMPHLSGHQVLRELRQLDPGVRVIFASGYSPDHLSEEEARGVLGFIQKPYRPHELARAVRQALNAG